MDKENLQQSFSVKRLYYLIRNRVYDDMGSVLIVAGAFLALNILLLLSAGQVRPTKPEIWTIVIALGGVLLAGNGFAKMHDGKAGTEWILLPASSWEKYMAAFGMYLLVYPIAASFIALCESLLLSGMAYLLYGTFSSIYNPFTPVFLQHYGAYAFFVIIALAGSARFKKFAIGKTAAIGFSFLLLSSLFLILGLLLTDQEGRQILFNGIRGQSSEIRRSLDPSKDELIRSFFKVYLTGTALFAIGYGYALIREKEARDEVQ